MTRKSPRTFVQILLLGLLLGTSSSAYADAISITSGSLSNLQIVPTSGTVVFSAQQPSSATRALALVSVNSEVLTSESQSETVSQTSISIGFASAAAASDFPNLSLSANGEIMLSGCVCSSQAEGLAFLSKRFTVVGGSGNVDVNLSGLLATMQTLVTDQFSLSAASTVLVTLQVFNASDLSGVHLFSFHSPLSIQGPNDSTILEIQRQLSEAFTLQFNTEYALAVSVLANSRAAQNEIPEPASVVLLVSGLGFLAGFVKKRRTGR